MEKGKRISMWLLYAILSSVFASLMTIFMKIGLKNISANLATTLRTTIVVILCWILVLITKETNNISMISKKDIFYLIIAGFATFGTWIFYFLALKDGATSKVLAIDRFSIVLTVFLSYFFLKEIITIKMFIGLIIIIIGTILVVF